jgi:hypothetical protein
VRLGRLNALRDRRPMLIADDDMLRRYVERRPTTSPRMRDQLIERDLLTLGDAAKRLGTHADWLRVGVRSEFLTAAETVDGGRRGPLAV